MGDLVTRVMPWVIGAFAIVVLGLAVGEAVFEFRHPCTKRGTPQMCSASQCVSYDSQGVCLFWSPYTYDCTPCVERDMREHD